MNDHTPIIGPIDLSKLRYYTSLKELDKDFGSDPMELRKVAIESAVVDKLEELKSKLIDGDILVYFISPEWTWDCLAGRAGYAIKRCDEYIDPVCVLLS